MSTHDRDPTPFTGTDAQRADWNLALGQRIIKRRMRLSLTREDLCDRTGLRRRSLQYVELGQRGVSAYALAALARALECSTDHLVGHTAAPWLNRGKPAGGDPETSTEQRTADTEAQQ